MRGVDLSPLLFLTPLASTILAAQDVTSARVSFCAATVLVEAVDLVDQRLGAARAGPTGRVLAGWGVRSRRLFLPVLALCPSLLLLAATSSSDHPVALGLRAAGIVGMFLGLALALLERKRRGEERRRPEARHRLVAEAARPVTSLSPVSWEARADLTRLAQVGYAVVGNPPSSPRLVRHRDVFGLPGELLTVVAWWEFGSKVPLVDGARPMSGQERLPEGDEVWLVTAGDLVIGVLTSESQEATR